VTDLAAYRRFLEAKVVAPVEYGDAVTPGAISTLCKPHQRAIIEWAVRGGRRAIFAKFGLGKTIMQLEIVRLTLAAHPGKGLIIAPLGVRQEFLRDAAMLGIPLRFVRTTAEMDGDGIYLTNYESVREGKIDVRALTVVSLDEAAVLRGFGGTKTFREFMATLAGDDRTNGVRTAGVPYRFVATATPSPNEYLELAAYAAFLGVMDVGEVKTRFFKRDSEKADKLTLYAHKEAEFWYWVNTWAVFLQTPADLSFPAEGYELPPLTVNWHTVHAQHDHAGYERDGQAKMIRDSAIGVQDAAAVKRETLAARVAKVRELVDARPDDHVIVWHDLEDERRALEEAIPGLVTVYGAQDLDEREASIRAFADGAIARIGAKPVMLGSGVNFQRHCHWAIFAGIGFKFNDFVQAIHRVWRYLQPGAVTIDIIFADAETEVRRALEAKWKRHDTMMARMSDIIREYGLNAVAARDPLVRSIGATRAEERGEAWTAVNNDCIEETAAMPADSIDLMVTSIPFGTQYEYSPSYNDFGHTDDDRHFFEQMDFLSPELLRVLKPGRVMCVHVKDRIRPGGLDGWSFQTVSPFHAETILHYRRHGFAYMGMITVVTDVVRENNQTYRLGWTEQCKDGSKMSVGMPEYVLLFRKPPTDSSDGYADERVVKSKADYSRARWQLDAHSFWRSNGNRLLTPADVVGVPADELFKRWREHSFRHEYDFEHHVAIGEAREAKGQLPPGFMLLPPHSWHPDVWSDVTRMRTLNGAQYAAGKELHLCPLQFDIVDRLIARFSNPGDKVYDFFGGLGTVALRAVELGRYGITVDLNTAYWADSVWYLRRADEKRAVPTLFDALEVEGAA
jgi:DNA modification methylase